MVIHIVRHTKNIALVFSQFCPRRIIAFRFIPNSVVTRPVGAVWEPLISRPWFNLPYKIRLAIGWLCLLGIVFGSAFGFPLQQVKCRVLMFLKTDD